MRLKKLFLCAGLFLLLGFSPVKAPNDRIIYVPYLVEKKLDLDYGQVSLIESGNNDQIVSKEGAIGRMQIMPIVLYEWNTYHPSEKYKLKDLYKRDINLKVGEWLLSKQIPAYFKQNNIPERLSYKLIAYNWGIGNFVKWYKNGHSSYDLPQETRDYLIKYWDKY